jgi:CheY-like chemotaxis protein
MGRVASGVAHEINNPLAYVMASLDVAKRAADRLTERRDDGAARELRDALAGALEGADHVLRIVRDVKMFSRDGAAELGPVDVRAVIESCARMAAMDLRERARLTLSLDDATPVLGSESRLAEIFLNLILNAAEAIPLGAREANEVRVVARRGGSKKLIIDVYDTGTGMTPEIKARIFEPFFTSKREGTGLGLSIVQAIVTSLGGQIHVDTTPGGGTCVTVTLRTAGPEAPTRSGDAPPARATLTGCRVLVVDHVASVGPMLRQALPAHDIVSAITASAALETLSHDRAFDALLVDAELTDRSAYELWFDVKRRYPGLERRIIFMMPSITSPSLVDPITRLPNRRIDKPFRLDELCELLAENVRERARPS